MPIPFQSMAERSELPLCRKLPRRLLPRDQIHGSRVDLAKRKGLGWSQHGANGQAVEHGDAGAKGAAGVEQQGDCLGDGAHSRRKAAYAASQEVPTASEFQVS